MTYSLPAETDSEPVSTLNKVDLPEPFIPTMQVILFRGILKLTSLRALNLPYFLVTPSSLSR